MFLLNLKKRYAGQCCEFVIWCVTICVIHVDGQKIAKRLCGQITKETKLIQSVVEELQDDASISLEEAMNPSNIGSKLGLLNLISEDQQDAIQAYLTLCRSKEEISMLKTDASMTINYYEQQRTVINDKMLALADETDAFSRGCKALLHRLLTKIDHLLEKGRLTLQTMATLTQKSFEIQDTSDTEESDEDLSDNEDLFY